MPINERGRLPLTELDSDRCPHCGVSLFGDLIPEDSGGGNGRRYRREVGIETGDYDGILYFVCPDCCGAWSRFVGGGTMSRLAAQHISDHNTRVAKCRRYEKMARATVASNWDALEAAVASFGAVGPIAWQYGPWDAAVTLYVRKEWVRDEPDEPRHEAARDATTIVGCPVRFQFVHNEPLRAMMTLAHLARDAEPWRDGDLTPLRDIEKRLRAREIALDDLPGLLAPWLGSPGGAR